ncbi:TPA: tail fiber assembly protein [Escherichia coli]|nr:tail fiber assembly protein [Escherichia coli]HDX2320444.1 tail fiber assembly protein [Escherichia coli]
MAGLGGSNWLRLLNRVDTSTAPDIEWPIIPVTS